MRIIRNAAACASGGEDSFFTEMYTLRIRLPVEVFKMYDRLTKGDIEKMEREIEERKLVKRPELIEAVKEARAQGDLSENFEYYAAKREKNQNESRIRYLERMIRTAEIVEDTAAAGEVSVNKTVDVYFPEDDETETDFSHRHDGPRELPAQSDLDRFPARKSACASQGRRYGLCEREGKCRVQCSDPGHPVGDGRGGG